MPFDPIFAAVAAGGLVTGAIVVMLLMRLKVASVLEEERARSAAETERLSAAAAEREGQVRRFEAEARDLEKRLAVAEMRNEAISGLETRLASGREREQQLEKELREISAAFAQEKEKAAHIAPLEDKLSEREQAVDVLREKLSARDAQIRELSTRMQEERKASEEKLALLNEAKAELANRFRVLAQEILEEKGKVFGEQSRTGLKTLLDPFREQLSEFKQKVETVYVDEAKERATLKREIEILRDLNRQISEEAVNLTRALKGDKKAQGTWGELILERVLEQSGLRKGVEYDSQGGFRDADGRLLKPDVIVHLPEDKDVVIDSKVSLVSYERYATSEVEAERSAALVEHVRAVKAHIDALSAKDYSSLKGLRSLDFVLLFMPIEAAFLAAFKEDENLFSYAFEKRIIVVTPTTLLASLKTIENIWRYERQNRSAQEIVQRASAIYDKLRLFVESMEKLGNQIDSVHDTFDEAMNRLMRGRGNLISQASRFAELGVPVKRSLPRTVTETAEIEGPVPDDAEEMDSN